MTNLATTADVSPALAPDPELPGRDALLDPMAVAGRLPGLVGDRPIGRNRQVHPGPGQVPGR